MTTGLGGAAAPQQARPDRDGDPAAAIALPDGSPAAVAAGLPPGNLVVLGGPGSGKTTLLEATMYDLAAAPTGAALFVTSSRQAAVAAVPARRPCGSPIRRSATPTSARLRVATSPLRPIKLLSCPISRDCSS